MSGFPPKLSSSDSRVGGLEYLKAPDRSTIPDESFQFFLCTRAARAAAIFCLHPLRKLVIISVLLRVLRNDVTTSVNRGYK